MSNSSDPFLPSVIFHIYNHGNGDDNIFRCDENYLYFLSKYDLHIIPFSEIYAYCLMPNHFHFLLRIQDEDFLIPYFKLDKGQESLEKLPELISKKFSNYFNAYSKAFNKRYDRIGRLFRSSLKRKQVNDENYLRQLVRYIHYNPVNHGFVKNLTDWPYSSYHSFINGTEDRIERKTVFEWFGGEKGFHEFHQQPPNIKIELDD